MSILRNKQKLLSVITLLVLIAVMVLSLCACKDSKTESDTDTDTNSVAVTVVTQIGEGEKTFKFEVVNGEESKMYSVSTDKTTVGEALLELGLISGDMGDYGLYVKTVDGVTADYDKDGTYWAFYVDGAYAMSGVDTTEIEEGKTYCFKVEK